MKSQLRARQWIIVLCLLCLGLGASSFFLKSKKELVSLKSQVATKQAELQDKQSQYGNIEALSQRPARQLKDPFMTLTEAQESLKDLGFMGVAATSPALNTSASAGPGQGVDFSTVARASTTYPGLKWIDLIFEAVYLDEGDAIDFASAVRSRGFISKLEMYGGKITITAYAPVNAQSGTQKSLINSLDIR